MRRGRDHTLGLEIDPEESPLPVVNQFAFAETISRVVPPSGEVHAGKTRIGGGGNGAVLLVRHKARMLPQQPLIRL